MNVPRPLTEEERQALRDFWSTPGPHDNERTIRRGDVAQEVLRFLDLLEQAEERAAKWYGRAMDYKVRLEQSEARAARAEADVAQLEADLEAGNEGLGMSDRIVYLDEELGNYGPSVAFDGDGGITVERCGEPGISLGAEQTAALVRALHYRYDCDRPDCTRVGVVAFGDTHLCREHATDRREGVEYRTKSGRVLTDQDIEALADEAERGYDVEHLRMTEPRERGTHVLVTEPIEVADLPSGGLTAPDAFLPPT